MKDTTKKIAYLRGLLASIQSDSPEAALMAGVIDALDQIDDDIDSLDDRLVDLNAYVESIDDDLTELEDATDGLDGDFDADDDMDFDDDGVDVEEKLHVVQAHPSTNLLLNGRLCANCKRLFMVSFEDDPEDEYVCPFCGAQMKPEPVEIEKIPKVQPVK